MGERVTGEAAIVARFAPLAELAGAYGLRDDCAELVPGPGQSLILKTDPIRAGVHFFAEDAPEDIAWKALAVNVSDLAAKGARPVAYLISCAFPEAPEVDWLDRFVHGLATAQDAMGLSLIGGDTDRAAGPMAFAVTVIGEVPAGRMVPRGGARPGDAIFVSGTLGASAAGLEMRLAQRSGRALPDGLGDGPDGAVALSRYLRPQPRLGLRSALRRCASAAMDLSDGLAKDLGRMVRASGCGARIEVDALPADPAAAILAPRHDARLQLIAGRGDDYEILAAVPPEHSELFGRLAAAGGVGVTKIGWFSSDLELRFVDGAGAPVSVAEAGYDHF